jgi:hypothetical protein
MIYEVEIDGEIYEVDVDSPDQIDGAVAEIRASENPALEESEPSFWDRAGDAIQTAGVIGSNIAGSAIGGLAGLGTIMATFDSAKGNEVLSATKDALSYNPDDEGVQQNLQAIRNSILGQLGGAYDNMTTAGADAVFERTGSPALATAAKVAPDAALEVIGLGSAMRAPRAVSRHLSRPEIQRLKDVGVEPTVGQTLGGVANRIEERATGIIPGATSARQRSIQQFQNGAINKALEPLGVKVEGFGLEAIEQGQKALDDAYQSARDSMPDLEITDSLFDGVTGYVDNLADELLDEQSINKVKNTYEKKVMTALERDKITSSELQKIESDLGEQIRKASEKGDRDVAGAFRDLQQMFRLEAAKQSPEYAAKVGRANAAYARFVDIEKAASKAGGGDGVFTPAQLKRSVKEGKSRREKAVGGRGDMAELSGDAVSVLGNKVNNSGSAERLLTGAAGGGALMGYVDPALFTGMLTSAAGGTRLGQKAANAAVKGSLLGIPAAGGAGMMALPLMKPDQK